MNTPDIEMIVRGLLAAGGLSLTDEQVAKYVAIYPMFRASADRLTDTSRLGSVRPKAVVAETDPEKMSPLVRASYEAKKKRGVTTDDAAAALAKKRSY